MTDSEQPHPGTTEDTDAEIQPTGKAPAVQLSDGEALTAASAATITESALARVVVLAGAVASGKTTLLASIYERFQKGPYAGYEFAGSDTLLGFERRCHGARVASESPVAETERTNPSEGLGYLHLRLRPKNFGSPIRDLLLTDVTGERFRQARDSSEECRKLGVLKRADHVVMLIDGQKLVSARDRYQAAAEADMLLRSCLDAEMLSANSLVDVVVAKWDIVQPAVDVDDTAEYLDLIERQFHERYGSRLGRLRFLRVAARPSAESTLTPAFGLEDLLPSWLEESPDAGTTIEDAEYDMPIREFNRFGMKQLSP